MLRYLAKRTAQCLLCTVNSRRAMSTFTLDPTIFNPGLYTQVTNVWLPGVGTGGEKLDEGIMKLWFTGSPGERHAFDSVCKDKFAQALEAIGPDRFPSPNCQPFMNEIEKIARTESWSQAAWTALSITLLLDQIPRNIYRTGAGLRSVYNHYDVISYSLARALLSPNAAVTRPDLHFEWRNSTAHRLWFYLPLMHSETMEAHDLLDQINHEWAKELQNLHGHPGTTTLFQGSLKSAGEHRDILERFGRYPHRNEILGRVSTEEEKRFLQDGGATFGVIQEKRSTQDKQEL
ncbi:hypothetical protein GQ44DRAFT_696200 [Phaeosphaeriaceae sp. PMI808]|nr:hypothetical protein GQ44DRAFT_696200 [Phaeosphaeriaceae sp. PMI808]